jgi:hypothetical protein
MKISDSSVELLKNFSDINNSLFVSKGNHIKTRSSVGNIHAEMTLEEEFPQGFGIYDLSTFIQMLTLFDEPEIDFFEKSLTISKEESKFEFFFADEELVKEVTSKIPKYNSLFEVKLTAKDVQTIKKTAGIIKATTISFIGDGKDVYLFVGDFKTSTKNTYKKKLGESENVFSYHLDISTFKVIVDDYTVNVAETRFVHFASESRQLDYVLAALDRSTTG